MMKRILAAAVVCFLASTAMAATVVIQPITVTSTGGWACDAPSASSGCTSPLLIPENMINQSGFSDPYVSKVTDFESYVASNPTEINLSEAIYAERLDLDQPPPSIVFDLGYAYEVSALALWNRGIDEQGIKEFSLYGALLPDFSDRSLLGTFEALEAPNIAGPFFTEVQVFRFDKSLVQYIDLDVVSEYVGAGDPFTTLSEVAFAAEGPPPGCIPSNYTPPKCEPWRPDGLTPVPLPAALPMLLAGIGGLGFVGHRRKRKSQQKAA